MKCGYLWKRFVGAALLAAALGSSASAQEAVLVGKVIDVDGPRLYTNRLKEQKVWYQGYCGMRTFLQEKLRTDKATRAVIEFLVGGRAGIDRNTRVQIISEQDVTEIGNTLRIDAGNMWAKLDKQKETFEIRTAGGVIGIEGTELLVGVDPETGVTEVLLFEGQVSVVDNEGKKKTLAPGDYAEFGAGKGMCVLSYPSASLRTLVVERFPSFSSFIANQDVTSIPKPASPTLVRGHNKTRPDLLTVRQSALESEGPEVRGLSSSGQSGPPAFSWDEVPGAASYAFYLSEDQAFEYLVFSSRTEGASLRVPEGAQGLASGRYSWSVVALDKEGEPLSKPGLAEFETEGWETPGVSLDEAPEE